MQETKDFLNLVKAAPSAAGRTAPIAKQAEKLSGKGTKLENQDCHFDVPAFCQTTKT